MQTEAENYRPDIDGLRAVAVLSVVLFHAFPGWFRSGFIGVDIFFVISGYLISRIIIQDLAANSFSFVNFYLRRIRRIFPALFLLLAACLGFGWFALFPAEYELLGKHSAAGAGFMANFIFFYESGYFDVEAKLKPLQHLWSLGVEEQFYLVFPALLLLFWKSKRPLLWVALLLAASFTVNMLIRRTHPEADFYMPWTRFWELLAGVVIALSPERRRAWPFIPHLLSILGLLLLAVGFVAIRPDQAFPAHRALWPVAGTALLLAAGPQGALNRVLACRPCAALGLVSYPFYLWHWPLLSYLRIIQGEAPSAWAAAAAVLLALALACATYFAVERPLRFGPRAKTIKALSLAGLIAVTGCAGGYIYLRAGLPARASIAPYLQNFQQPLLPLFSAAVKAKQYSRQKVENARSAYITYLDLGRPATIAILGDSHATYAFPAIANYNADLHNKMGGVNTLALAQGGNTLFSCLAGDDFYKEGLCEMYLQKLETDNKISSIFVFAYNGYWQKPDRQKIFVTAISNLRQRLSDKKIFIVADNPTLDEDIKYYMSRPFRYSHDFHKTKVDVYKEQKEYLEMLGNLEHMKDITVIYTLDAFCPNNLCLFRDAAGYLMYKDYNHISDAGGAILVEKVLKQYLDSP